MKSLKIPKAKYSFRSVIIGFAATLTITITSLLLANFTLWAICTHFYRFIPRDSALFSLARQRYMGATRNIIQFSSCATYDPEVTYTLKPGECDFDNLEFKTHYQINSLGLRDDEDSLKSPQILVLGDSHGMGFGVQQDETFASLIEKQTNKKTLNAAISGFGTAREYLLSKRLDLSKLEYLIIQYCGNDDDENHTFIEKGFTLPITSKSDYETIAANHRGISSNQRKYGSLNLSYTHDFISLISNSTKPTAKPDLTIPAQDFLTIVSLLKLPAKTKIVILDSDEIYNLSKSSQFIAAVKEALQKDAKWRHLRKQAIVLDVAQSLNASDFFILDDHINSSGHQKIANQILKVIEPRKTMEFAI